MALRRTKKENPELLPISILLLLSWCFNLPFVDCSSREHVDCSTFCFCWEDELMSCASLLLYPMPWRAISLFELQRP